MSTPPPVKRFRLELSLTANSMQQLAHEFDLLSNDFDLKVFEGRTTMEIVSGAGYILKVTEPDPTMTDERYYQELDTWFENRKNNGE